MPTLKILRLTNPETKKEVIRPRVVDNGEYFPVLKPNNHKSYLATIKSILKGDITMSDLKKMNHDEYGTYYLIKELIVKPEVNKHKRLQKKEEDKKKLQYEGYEQLNEIEAEEFEGLIAELESKRFTKSHEVSDYIIRNRLGDKYQNISGVLEMKNRTSSWKFKGGFPPKIYAMLCERLDLDNKGTESRVTGFTSFKDLKKYK